MADRPPDRFLTEDEALDLAESPPVARHGVPAELLVACAKAESSLNASALRVEYHRDGSYRDESRGLMQILTGTCRDLHGDPDELWDPAYSLELAARYLAQIRRYLQPPGDEENRWLLAVAGYNAGMGRVDRAIERARPAVHVGDVLRWLDSDVEKESWSEKITRRHVTKVRRFWHNLAAERDHE